MKISLQHRNPKVEQEHIKGGLNGDKQRIINRLLEKYNPCENLVAIDRSLGELKDVRVA
tara:strand:+ start:412 stop:588 length:177 start_codon:yes stop_codon:yes gene_type:complete